MEKKNLQPKQKAPVVRPTAITPPQLSEEQLTAGMAVVGGQGLQASQREPDNVHCFCCAYDD